ncbi:MAG: ATP-binding cassette domain-containing protein [Thermoflexales bacterium]|nr:ATP-binding cassette domain-containing protein [Thermoflexales bacterium]MCS7323785.1 ATP-binding cassette domain-containing protein [Thermoflexales bacterium]MCX7939769.1 ATP-binding cassette domain-containing protein [Thermoflexales bacterium]MDW8053893.1 ATP-binding cassette domain-containing protein [Anaerolineae bacterium]MDW8292434.1 ATP-binding cassette domain-containing protein [Anaerolineae bacterium]
MDVELRHIHKWFGAVHANDDISLRVRAGTIHGLLGENGAGKSTLAKILSGYITRDSGEIILDGRLVDIRTPTDAIRAGIGMLHQDPLDFPPLTVLENFMLGQAGRRLWLDQRGARRMLASLAERFHFMLNPEAHVSELTVGERQQLEMLRLLALGARVLILDEPTTGISAEQKTLLFAALRQLAEEGKAIIFVSHKLEDIEALCDEVTVLRHGRVVGTVALPCPAEKLVAMMFGKVLAEPSKPHTTQDDIAFELHDAVIRTELFDLHIAHLAVHRGEVIGLAGLEGSGQQAFLAACAGVERLARGTLRINGQDMTHRPYRDYLAAGVCYVPADRLRDGLIPGLTIREHVALRAPRGFFVDRTYTQQLAEAAIRTFNIRGTPESRVEQLSGGNQQRTQLALMPSPLSVLFMEHPTRGLDIESTLWVWQQLIARCQQGTAIVFASSDLDEVLRYSDRVLVFSGGRVSPPLSTTALTVDQLGHMIGGKF